MKIILYLYTTRAVRREPDKSILRFHSTEWSRNSTRTHTEHLPANKLLSVWVKNYYFVCTRFFSEFRIIRCVGTRPKLRAIGFEFHISLCAAFFFVCSCCHLPSVDETHTLTIFCVVNRTRKIDVGQITCRHSPGGMRVRTLLAQEMGWRHKLLCLDFRQFLFSHKFERFRFMKFLCIVKHILYMRLSFPALPTVVFISLLYSRSLYCVVF